MIEIVRDKTVSGDSIYFNAKIKQFENYSGYLTLEDVLDFIFENNNNDNYFFDYEELKKLITLKEV